MKHTFLSLLLTLQKALLNHKVALFILAVWLLLFITNFSSGTYLSGWDNLQTELNPSLAVKRAVFSVWEEYQSFGLTAGMSHAADLPRALLLWGASLIIPEEAIRYTFHMSMVLLGALGIYRLLLQSGMREKKSIAGLGAVFYLLNFFLIQIIFLPFESFTTLIGVLPWFLFVFLKTVTTPSRKNFLLFLVVNFLGVSAFYSQQLFVVYSLLLVLTSVGVLITKKSLQSLKTLAMCGLLLFAANSFWIMPQVYFLNTSGYVVTEAKMNQLATEDVFYQNKSKGNLFDLLTFKGFFYESVDPFQQPLFASWKAYQGTIPITIILLLLSTIVFVGFIPKSTYKTGIILSFMVVVVALLLNTPPFSFINDLLRSNSFINQIFRSPFTKFVVPYALFSSYFFAWGVFFIVQAINQYYPKIIVLNSIIATGFLLVIIQALPAFSGFYISPQMKVKIPQEYHDVISYFQSKDKNSRIAILPDYTFWGWFYTKWGYNGSGFLWYAVEQPIVSRTFDVWSLESESYFWEVKQALESEDADALATVLEKYNITYLLYDKNLRPIVSNIKAIQYDRIDLLLAHSEHITLEKQFGTLAVYKIKPTHTTKNFVSVAKNVPNIGPLASRTNQDTAYEQYGVYQTDSKAPFAAYFPFLNLTSQTRLTDKNWSLKEFPTEFETKAELPFDLQGYVLSNGSATIPINGYVQNQSVSFLMPVSIVKNEKSVTVNFPIVEVHSFTPSAGEVKPCHPSMQSSFYEKEKAILHIESKNGNSGCFLYQDAFLDQQNGYVVRVINKNVAGQRLFFYVSDATKEQPYIEDRIKKDVEYYVIGSKYTFGKGYNFAFQNTSYKNLVTENRLTNLAVFAFPYNELKQLSLRKNEEVKTAEFVNDFKSKKINYYTYKVELEKAGPNTTIILNQAFHSGWKAYEVKPSQNVILTKFADLVPFFAGKELKEHVVINNWSNGWNLNYTLDAKPYTLILIFWPQYLQYIGYIFLGGTFIALSILVLKDKLSARQ